GGGGSGSVPGGVGFGRGRAGLWGTGPRAGVLGPGASLADASFAGAPSAGASLAGASLAGPSLVCAPPVVPRPASPSADIAQPSPMTRSGSPYSRHLATARLGTAIQYGLDRKLA